MPQNTTLCQVLTEKKINLPPVYRNRLIRMFQDEGRFQTHRLSNDDVGNQAVVAADALWFNSKAESLDDIAILANLTFERWKKYRLWCFQPIDRSKKQMDAWRDSQRQASSLRYRDKKRLLEQKQRQLERVHARQCQRNSEALPPREAAIVDMLARDPALTAPNIVKQASKLDAFKHGRNHATWCNPPSCVIVKDLRKIVHRTLKRLHARGLIDLETYTDQRGKRVTLATLRAAENHYDTMTPVMVRKAA